MSASGKLSVLVTGATGTQGGAVARGLKRVGVDVRALVRDASAAPAQALATLGIDLIPGNLEDERSLAAAARDVGAVFSVQAVNPREPAAEVRQASKLIGAARDAGVRVFVQSTVSGVDLYCAARDAGDASSWDRDYWQAKADVEREVIDARFDAGAILRPAFMMENFIGAKASRMFPGLDQGTFRSAIAPDTELALAAADDIAGAAVHAILKRTPVAVLELASDRLTPPAIAGALGQAWKRPIRAETASPETLLAEGFYPGWLGMQSWFNAIGYPARPELLQHFGVAPTPLRRWAEGVVSDE